MGATVYASLLPARHRDPPAPARLTFSNGNRPPATIRKVAAPVSIVSTPASDLVCSLVNLIKARLRAFGEVQRYEVAIRSNECAQYCEIDPGRDVE